MKILLLLAALPLFAQQPRLLPFIDLTGDWHIRFADEASYAAQDFDDRDWETVQLPWKTPAPLGTFWLRRSVTLPTPFPAESLAVAVGSIDATYEVFVNAVSVGHGLGPGDNPPESFSLRGRDTVDQVTIAIRVHNGRRFVRSVVQNYKDDGPYALGSSLLVETAVRGVIAERRNRRTPFLLAAGAFLLSGVVILVVWRQAIEWKVLFWLMLVLLLNAGNYFRHVFGSDLGYPGLLYPIAGFLLGLVTETELAAAGIVPGKLRLIIWILVAAVQTGAFVSRSSYVLLQIPLSLIPISISLFVLYNGPRAARSQAAFIGLYATNILLQSLQLMPGYYTVGPWQVPTATVVSVPASLAVVLLLIRQLVVDRREKQRLTSEVEAARTVQQLLLAQHAPESDEYLVEAQYRPAQEVGGDFFYWLKTNDGSLLLATGDVSGKGLKAAMLVSLIIGALRSFADRSPGRVLASLNEAVHGQTGGGFVTCICARFAAGGTLTIANAGHITPYVDGKDVSLESGLPLGLTSGVVFGESAYTLASGATVTFVSDGVVEATNPAGELFGFDRTRAISGQPAQDIVTAAQAFGQNDDITVLTVRRVHSQIL